MSSRPPHKRTRASHASDSGGSSVSRVSQTLGKVKTATKKIVNKAVGFVTPRKNTARGTQSDTPRAPSARTIQTRHSSMFSIGSTTTAASNQSSFQLPAPDNNNDGDSVSDLIPPSRPASSVGDDDLDAEEDEELTQEQKDRIILDKARKGWTSYIYAFYYGEVSIEYRDGKPHHVFTCSSRGCSHKIYRNQTTKDSKSTKNLQTHAKKCWGVEIVAAAKENGLVKTRELLKDHRNERTQRLTDIFKAQAAANGGELYSSIPHAKDEIRAEHVRWVSESLRPFSISEDRAYRRLMKTGRPTIFIPSPDTIARDVKLLFKKTRERLAQRLKKAPVHVNLATDAWTSPNHRPFIAVSGHWEEQGQRINCLLDFIEVPKSHNGDNLAEVLDTVAQDFGISSKILSVTCDNASSNDVMAEKLEEHIPGYNGTHGRTRCFAHIINLVAKSFLKLFDPPRDKDVAPDESEPDALANLEELVTELNELERTESEQDDGDDLFDEVAHMLDADREEFLDSTKEVRSALHKLRTVANKTIHSSTLLLPAWRSTVKEHGKTPRMLPRDVRTRWNSTFTIINVALTYKKPLRDFISDHLSEYTLSAAEWTLLEDLQVVLVTFKDATFFCSRDSATLATVIPAMDKIDSMLATAVVQKSSAHGASWELSAPMKIAVLTAKKTLNRYYSLAFHSRIYRFATILHPRYKIGYLRDQDWEEDDIASATQELTEEFKDYFIAHNDAIVDLADGTDSESEQVTTKQSASYTNMFDAMDVDDDAAAGSSMNELTRYLAEPRITGVGDVLRWWSQQSREYPVLSRMARDHLSVPPTSVYVERQFSRGRLLISSIRNRLSAETVRALMCLGNWSTHGMIDASDMRVVSNLPTVEEEGEIDVDII